jgi:GH15 family glucan-1,4-alpha-glucosidase
MPALIPYPAIERHAVIGDRRTAALVAADGTIDWLCLPDYDGTIVFGALLDSNRGGHWRVGPAALWSGEQAYEREAPIVHTRWRTDQFDLELIDAMAQPQSDRAPHDRIVLRRLMCVRGTVECAARFAPAANFTPMKEDASISDVGRLRLWSERPDVRTGGTFTMRSGDEAWMVMSCGADEEWAVERAERLLEEVRAFWRECMRNLDATSPGAGVLRSAATIRLLEYAPCGSSVAAPTTSVPERIGGGWNADYRFTWVRDASLAMAALAQLGDVDSAGRYLDWVTRVKGRGDAPLQVLYTIRGEDGREQRDRNDVEGYRASRPVRVGNHAYKQTQHDIFGYFADCVDVYLQHGGRWRDDVWQLLCRSADYVATHWEEKGNGIWELDARERYVSGQVMAWVALDRVRRIGARGRQPMPRAAVWARAGAAIRDNVERHGWSERRKSFTQSIGGDALDASALLIPLTGFLPTDDPRVRSTVEAVAADLTIDGLVYRFDPAEAVHGGPAEMGEFECAFLPCTFWLATCFALLGRIGDAEDVLAAVSRVAGPLGLYAESIDPRNWTFAGNTPLLFSHVEHIRAEQTLRHAREGDLQSAQAKGCVK